MKSILAIVALATSFAAAAAQDAIQELPNPGVVFEELDADRDGYLSEDELHVSTSLKLDMKSADADKDGKISKSELATAFKHGPANESGAAGPAGDLPPTAK
jgi:Ca2+-binding EF-hand superfamily protein